jgi:hypothetical protein
MSVVDPRWQRFRAVCVLAATARNLSLPDDQPVIVCVADSSHFFKMADRDEQPKRDMKAVKSQPIAAAFVAPGIALYSHYVRSTAKQI